MASNSELEEQRRRQHECISRESNQDHSDGNDACYHQTTDASDKIAEGREYDRGEQHMEKEFGRSEEDKASFQQLPDRFRFIMDFPIV